MIKYFEKYISPEGKRFIALADDPRWKYNPILFGKIEINFDENSRIDVWSDTIVGIINIDDDEFPFPAWGWIEGFVIECVYISLIDRLKKEYRKRDAKRTKDLFNAFFDKWNMK